MMRFAQTENLLSPFHKEAGLMALANSQSTFTLRKRGRVVDILKQSGPARGKRFIAIPLPHDRSAACSPAGTSVFP